MPPTVLLFLKAPRPGFVKTRLAVSLGEEAACQVYRQLAEHTLSQIPSDWPCHIFYTPRDSQEEMASWLGTQHHYYAQSEGDLGQRLSTASQKTFAEGASSTILLGGDCPDIRIHHLKEAAQHLAKKTPVIGPAVDGGYWLLGLPHHCPDVFQEIPWSTPQVFPSTLRILEKLALSPIHLTTLEDVDDHSSWARHPELKNAGITHTKSTHTKNE